MLIDIFFVSFVSLMFLQGLASLFLSLYIWGHPDRIEQSSSPARFSEPEMTFTILLPARHEEVVIGKTILNVANVNYPEHLVEIFVICESEDLETINSAKKMILSEDIRNASVISFSDRPINKPHGLNIGLNLAHNDIIAIFDAEDDISEEILNIANTAYLTQGADVVQAGVQLMNYDSTWFSSHNVLEYYFWFKSRMHFQTKVGVVPLGGNTVFFKKRALEALGGWNESCLTEDADIGIRMSAAGAKIISTYDARHVTKEETPETISSFIKQRTRWNQGFIQVLKYGHWKEYDTFPKRAFCFYSLAFPILQGVLFILSPLAIFVGFHFRSSVVVSLLSFFPILLAMLQLIVYVVGIHEFEKEQSLKHKYWVYALMVISIIPYQILLGLGAIRATVRELKGVNNWEKTEHNGLHREVSLQPE